MHTTWVVVADEGIARIFQLSPGADELAEVDDITDAAAHAKDADLRRDAYGRRTSGAARGVRGTTPYRRQGTSTITSSAGEDDEHQEAEEFARRVAQRLEQELHRHHYDDLRIVAAPRFLGLLRKSLSDEVARAVSQEIDKDLIHLNKREITQRVFGKANDGVM